MSAAPLVRLAGELLPATLTTAEAANWLGGTAQTLQRNAGTDRCPVTPIRMGARLVWPTARVAEALGLPYELVPQGDTAA